MEWYQAFLASFTGGLVTAVPAYIGVVRAQHMTGEREETERRWQQEAWARDRRREAHTAFLTEQRRLENVVYENDRDGCGQPAPDDWHLSLDPLLVDVEVFGSLDAAIAARRVFTATGSLPESGPAAFERLDAAVRHYRYWVQRDLGLTPTGVPLWGMESDGEWRERGLSPAPDQRIAGQTKRGAT